MLYGNTLVRAIRIFLYRTAYAEGILIIFDTDSFTAAANCKFKLSCCSAYHFFASVYHFQLHRDKELYT